MADGKKLYRELIGPLAGDGPADAFADLDLDNRGNRMALERVAAAGGERGLAARARLDKWTADQADDNRDPFDGPTAA